MENIEVQETFLLNEPFDFNEDDFVFEKDESCVQKKEDNGNHTEATQTVPSVQKDCTAKEETSHSTGSDAFDSYFKMDIVENKATSEILQEKFLFGKYMQKSFSRPTRESIFACSQSPSFSKKKETKKEVYKAEYSSQTENKKVFSHQEKEVSLDKENKAIQSSFISSNKKSKKRTLNPNYHINNKLQKPIPFDVLLSNKPPSKEKNSTKKANAESLKNQGMNTTHHLNSFSNEKRNILSKNINSRERSVIAKEKDYVVRKNQPAVRDNRITLHKQITPKKITFIEPTHSSLEIKFPSHSTAIHLELNNTSYKTFKTKKIELENDKKAKKWKL